MSEKVVCAAVRFGDGLIVCGARHFDLIMHRQIAEAYKSSKRVHRPAEQGFINQRGGFKDRKEALIIARNAGQLEGRMKSGNPNSDELFSEDLY